MSKQSLPLSGGLTAEIDPDEQGMIIHLVYAGTQDYSHQRFFASEDSLEPVQEIRTPVITEISFADIRKIYMTYIKREHMRKIESMDAQEFEDYLLRDDC
jgi:threonyl-tRNA synthetase